MKYRLTSEKLREQFGKIELIIIFQDSKKRISAIKSSADNRVLTYHTVEFFEKGIISFGVENHQKIVNGDSMGETIKKTKKQHTRTDGIYKKSKINLEMKKAFSTKKTECFSRTVEYTIEGSRYTVFTEYYNPEIFKTQKSVK